MSFTALGSTSTRSYEGTLTDASGADCGLYEMDGAVWLFLTHQVSGCICLHIHADDLGLWFFSGYLCYIEGATNWGSTLTNHLPGLPT